jgi:predicted alpha-1,2-mannosidase
MKGIWLAVLLLGWACSGGDSGKDPASDTTVLPDARGGDAVSDVADHKAPDDADPGEGLQGDLREADSTELDGIEEVTEPPGLNPFDYINPFIGSGGDGFLIGSGTPAATWPFGLVKLGPDTMDAHSAPYFYHCSGYWYPDEYIIGFSHLHVFGTGAPDYGVLLVKPVIGMTDALTEPMNYRQTFKKKNEHAEVGLYRVLMDDGIEARLSTTPRVGVHRYTWPTGAQRVVLVDVGHAISDCEVREAEVTVNAETREIAGRILYAGSLSGRGGGFNLYFVARFDQAWTKAGTWGSEQQLRPDLSCEGKDCGTYLDFGTGEGPVDLKVGVSFVGIEGARKNLLAEADTLTLEEAIENSRQAWKPLLDTVQVQNGGTQDELTIFYTALYHTFFMPHIASDVDGRYQGMDKQVHLATGHTYYTDFSIWDTYRTLHPLLVLLAPEAQTDMVASLTRMYEQGGAFPRWPIADHDSGCMIGTHADIVMADSFLKDIPLEDPVHAFEGLLITAKGPKPPGAVGAGRSDIEGYIEKGYCRADVTGSSVSWTMEIAHDDYALAQMAQALGRDDDYDFLLKNSENYRNLWNPEYGFFLPKDDSGDWHDMKRPFDPTRWEDWFTEGGAWQYLWYVPHNPMGLAELMGGPQQMVDRLIEFFQLSKDYEDNITLLEDFMPRPYYWHGNEPDMHAAYLFSALGRQDLAAKWAHWIKRTHYKNAPQGIPGNDDCGTMSSWYVFSAMGFLPIPGTPLYYLGKPLFADATMKIQDQQLRVVAEGPMSPTSVPVETWFNGTLLSRPELTWEQLKQGGELRFVLAEPE